MGQAERLGADLAVEVAVRVDQVEAIRLCEALADYVTRRIVREILTDTGEHIDFRETQISLMGSRGEANYLQSAMGELAAGD